MLKSTLEELKSPFTSLKNFFSYRQKFFDPKDTLSSPTDSRDVKNNSEKSDSENESGEQSLTYHKPVIRVKFRRYGTFFIILYSLGHFSISFLQAFLIGIMLPEDILFFVGDSKKSSILGVVVGLTTIILLVSTLIFGYLSDLIPIVKIGKIEIGKRKIFIIGGQSLLILTVIIRSFFKSNESPFYFWCYILIGLAGNIFAAMAMSAYTGFYPDLFEKDQYNSVSMWMTFLNLFGAAMAVGLVGFFWSVIQYNLLILIICAVDFLTIIQLLVFSEEKSFVNAKKEAKKLEFESSGRKNSNTDDRKKKNPIFSFDLIKVYFKAFFSWNYSVAFLGMLFSMFSLACVQSFILYHLRDVVRVFDIFGFKVVSNEEAAQSVMGVVGFVFAVFSAFFGPFLANYISHKWVIFMTGVINIIAKLGFIVLPDFTSILFATVLLGLSMGAFYAVFSALTNSVLPNLEESGKDLAMFSISSVFPFIVTSPIMGWIIQWGNQVMENFGYNLMLATSIAFQFLGCLVVLLVRNKDEKEEESGKEEVILIEKKNKIMKEIKEEIDLEKGDSSKNDTRINEESIVVE